MAGVGWGRGGLFGILEGVTIKGRIDLRHSQKSEGKAKRVRRKKERIPASEGDTRK